MREMKDSGIQWIGQIPENWIPSKIKFVATIHNGDRGSNYPSGDDMVDDGIYFITTNNIDGIKLNCNKDISKFITEERYNLLGGAKIELNDIIYCLRGSIGKCAINKNISQGTIASSLTCLRVKKAIPDYINYFLQSNIVLDQVKLFMNGTCAANLSAENVANFFLLEPPLTEQTRIANFLDQKCSAIDSVLEKTRASIEEYKKLKQSVITQAVTKGIRPNRQMKDSGIEWIGQIPKDWEICKIKHLLQSNKDGIKIGPFGSSLTNKVLDKDEGNYKIYGQWNIVKSDFSAGKNYISQKTFEELISYQVYPYDVLISMMGTIGKCATIPNGIVPGIMDSHVIKARLNNGIILNKFFEYEYDKDCSNFIYEQILKKKTGSIMDGLNSSIVKNLYFLLPPITEQQAIADYLDTKCSEIDNLIAKKEQFLKEIETYKKSLIYEYVTGKKEVL